MVFGQISAAFSQSGDLAFKVQTRMSYSEDNKHGTGRMLVHEFKKDAFKALMADPTTPQAKARLIEQYIDEMTAAETVDKFFTSFEFTKPCDTGSGKGCGEVRDNSIILRGMAFISMNAIDNFLQSKSAAASGLESSDFAMMFIARKVSNRTKYNDKTTKVSTSSSAASSEVTMGGDDTTTASGGSEESISVESSGGSTEVKADAFVYDIDLGLTNSLQSAVQEQLINAGFTPFSVDDILYDYDMDALEDLITNGEFGDDGSLNRRTMAAIKKVVSEDGVSFFGVGLVDYRLGESNQATGEMRVPAIVSVEVFQSKGKRMKAVASVKPTAIFGEYPKGGDYTTGQIDAQNKAAKKAMETIISQLQVAGLY
tara:strand:- start:76 stop:1185 length:1110 start_codon:yes stop_codon:yes gene_type:complete